MSGDGEEANPQAVARASADAMWANDRASAGLGIRLDDVGPGYALMSLDVTDAMTNGHDIVHGGFIFTLADTAFAFACNSRGDRAVAYQCAVTFIRPGKQGDRLVASAHEVSRAGRAGIYDVQVSVDGEVIAEFRGHSRTIGGSWTA